MDAIPKIDLEIVRRIVRLMVLSGRGHVRITRWGLRTPLIRILRGILAHIDCRNRHKGLTRHRESGSKSLRIRWGNGESTHNDLPPVDMVRGQRLGNQCDKLRIGRQ